MTRPQGWRMVWSAGAVALVGCASTGGAATAIATPDYLQQYANAGSALDTATTTWDALGQALVAAGTNTVANEAPIDAAYAKALDTFSKVVTAIHFPAAARDAVHQLAVSAGDVRHDLSGVASGAVSTTQFLTDESKLQDAINLVQQELGLGSSTPIAAP